MNRRSQAIIGATIVVLGLGLVALGFFDAEANVRQVEQLLADPHAHTAGTYILIGIPQAPQIPAPGSDGSDGAVVPNPAYQNQTRHVVAWTQEDTTYHSTHTLTVNGPDSGGVSHWNFRNETREPGRAELAFPVVEESWTVTGRHSVFLVRGFADDNGDAPDLFAVYWGNTGALFPKMSQFDGRLMATLPGGGDVPIGALVYEVESYTQQCSSKLIPEELHDHPEVRDAI